MPAKIRFDANGMIPAFVTDISDGKPLMMAFMNEEALRLTLETGEAHFYSRSRQSLWHKGATSGNVLAVHDVHVDCDQDTIWLTATPKGHGAACHTGRKSCFFLRLSLADGQIEAESIDDQLMFDPKDVY